MNVKTGLKAGDEIVPGPGEGRRPGPKPYPPPPPPPPVYDYTCDHCSGTKNRWGGLNSATCNSCW